MDLPTSAPVQLLLALFPNSGQLTARRNAWAGMSEGSIRARARREADAAMDVAHAKAHARAQLQSHDKVAVGSR